VYRQYDHQVQNNTVLLPGGGDAAVVRLRPQEPLSSTPATHRGVAATVDCNSRYVYLDPYEGAKAVVAEAARNLSCVGAEPIAVTDNLNFGSPEKPVGYWQLASACKGISEACSEFSTPVTGGNVSLYNETLDAKGQPTPIYPTPVIGMVGLIPDISQVCGQGWRNPGDVIYLLGLPITAITQNVSLGGSEYLAAIHETVAGKPPVVDYQLERQVQTACREGIRQGWIQSAHDSAEGGLMVALAESCIGGNLGAKIILNADTASVSRWDEILFAEGGARIVVSVSLEQVENWESYLQQDLEGNWQKIGEVSEIQTDLIVNSDVNLPLIDVSMADMRDRWSNAIERRLSASPNLPG
ncbi:MAG: AIR synthase related protein, partial [Chroococcales cyanobacterium]